MALRWSVSSTGMILLRDGDVGNDVVQKDLQGSVEVGLILKVADSGGDGSGLEWVQTTAV